jgi:UDP-glucose 4-epimerase
MVLPRFVKAAKNNELLNIHGDGKQSRVFCHVKDSVSAIIKLTQLDNSVGQVFNIGGLEEISILNLANLVIKLTGSKSTLSLIPYSEAYSNGYEDMKQRVPDITKIRNFTGWEPKNSLSNIISDIQNSID